MRSSETFRRGGDTEALLGSDTSATTDSSVGTKNTTRVSKWHRILFVSTILAFFVLGLYYFTLPASESDPNDHFHKEDRSPLDKTESSVSSEGEKNKTAEFNNFRN